MCFCYKQGFLQHETEKNKHTLHEETLPRRRNSPPTLKTSDASIFTKIYKSKLILSLQMIVSFAAVLRDVTQRPPRKERCVTSRRTAAKETTQMRTITSSSVDLCLSGRHCSREKPTLSPLCLPSSYTA